MTRAPMTAAPRPAALHQRIRREIEEMILSGAWRPGCRIPFEHELTAQYGCSRMTVSKAISALVDAGLIVRRRRAGSFVARPRIHSVVVDIPDIAAEIASRGEPYGYRLLARRARPASARSTEERSLAGDGRLLDLRCLHLASGRPFALEERLISLASVPEAAEVDFGLAPPGSWLLGHVAWTEAEHRIAAANADGPTAELLAIPPGAACLVLERRTWRGGEPITTVRQTFPGDAYDMVARFAPAHP